MASGTTSISSTTAPSATASLWRHVRRWAVPLFGVLVLGLLLSHAHKIDWAGAWQALKRYPPSLLLAVLGVATLSHALYACFDLIGRHHTRHALPAWRTWTIALTCYAFNLNLGALVGGVALRARLYTRAGLDEAAIAQVVGLSLATNWIGYGVLAGSLFAMGAIDPPSQIHLGRAAFHALGAAMLLLGLGYVVACALARGREWRIRGRRVHLPSPPLALVQLALSTANWMLMGFAMYLLLGRQVPYTTTLGVLLAASIVGGATAIPGGLGVLEAVYLALLSGTVPQGKLMGAVLAYRALYYLLPLAGAVALYFGLERYAAAHPAPTPEGAAQAETANAASG